MDVVRMAGWVWSLGVAVWWSGCGGMAFATEVALAGLSGNKALLVVDKQPPRFVVVGDKLQQVRVVSVDMQSVTVEVDGQRRVLRLGETPVNVGGGGRPASGTSTVLFANGQGHFITQGRVNEHTVTFMVDTGASSIALGRSDGQRAGIKHGDGKGQEVRIHTANGVVGGWKTELKTVRVGELELRNVTVVVLPHDMPMALLGNSFLSEFRMQRDGEKLVLERRY